MFVEEKANGAKKSKYSSNCIGHLVYFWDWSETETEGISLFVKDEFSISSTKSQRRRNRWLPGDQPV